MASKTKPGRKGPAAGSQTELDVTVDQTRAERTGRSGASGTERWPDTQSESDNTGLARGHSTAASSKRRRQTGKKNPDA